MLAVNYCKKTNSRKCCLQDNFTKTRPRPAKAQDQEQSLPDQDHDQNYILLVCQHLTIN